MLGFAKILMYASIFSAVVPLAFLTKNLDKLKKRYFMGLGLLILASFLTDISSWIATKTHLLPSNGYLTNSYNAIQFILLLFVYSELYMRRNKQMILVLCLIYFGFEIINSLYLQELSDSQTWTKALSGLIFTGLSVGYFYHLLKSDSLVDFTKFAPGWINIAVFFYFSFSVYLFIIAEYVFTNESMETAVVFWGFHNLNNILKNCFFAAAIYWGAQRNLTIDTDN